MFRFWHCTVKVKLCGQKIKCKGQKHTHTYVNTYDTRTWWKKRDRYIYSLILCDMTWIILVLSVVNIGHISIQSPSIWLILRNQTLLTELQKLRRLKDSNANPYAKDPGSFTKSYIIFSRIQYWFSDTHPVGKMEFSFAIRPVVWQEKYR